MEDAIDLNTNLNIHGRNIRYHFTEYSEYSCG